MPHNILLVLGAGGRIGAALASTFTAKGYKVALASRSTTTGLDDNGIFKVQADLANPAGVEATFQTVAKQFGAWPSVVVYNAAALTINPDPLAIAADSLPVILNVNIVSAYAAAQQTVQGRSGTDRVTFIYTGNITNTTGAAVPAFITLGIGKAGAANMLESIGTVYADKNALFYYADERTAEGKSAGMNVDGPGHADFYLELVNRSPENPGPIIETFVSGKGYVKF